MKSIIAANENKSMKTCLDIFIKRFRELKHDLNTEFQTNKFFHDKLLRSCRDVSACKYVCMKFSETILELINDLRSFIIIETFLNLSKTYFTNRQYHTLDSRSNRFQRPRFQSQRFYTFRTIKRCFVCNKEEC